MIKLLLRTKRNRNKYVFNVFNKQEGEFWLFLNIITPVLVSPPITTKRTPIVTLSFSCCTQLRDRQNYHSLFSVHLQATRRRKW